MKKTIWSPEGITEVDLTVEEIKQAEEETKVISERETQREEDKKAKEDLKASAKAKLIAGDPLTEDEANTIIL